MLLVLSISVLLVERPSLAQMTANKSTIEGAVTDDKERQVKEISSQNPHNFSRGYNWSNFRYGIRQAPLGVEVTGQSEFRSGLPIDAIKGADTSQLLTPKFGNRPLISPALSVWRNSFRNRAFNSLDLPIAKNLHPYESLMLQLNGDLVNAFNFSNMAFTPAILYPDNPAFVYGPGILSSGAQAAPSSSFVNPRTSNSACEIQRR